MRRFMALLGLALLGFAVVPPLAQAQVIYVQPARTYVAPVVVTQPVVTSYYYAPAPPVTYSSSYYAAPPVTYSSSYYSAPPVVTYSSPAPVVAYSAPVVTYSAPVVAYSAPVYASPAPGYYETRSYYGFGIFRPRGWTTETYYRP